jgi:hypothetical protein
MSKTFIFVNGRTDNAEAWIEGNTPHKATRMEYACGVLTRRFHQNSRVDNLETICKKYANDKICLVGHSNGCDIILRLIQRRNMFFDHVHLIAGACENDFNKNALNETLALNLVRRLSVYWSKNDKALKKARISSTLLSWIGLGYGFLGLTGPKNLYPELSIRVTSIEKKWGHSDWFREKNFEETMHLIAA